MSDRPTPSAVCLPRIQVLGTSVGAWGHWGGFQGQDPFPPACPAGVGAPGITLHPPSCRASRLSHGFHDITLDPER